MSTAITLRRTTAAVAAVATAAALMFVGAVQAQPAHAADDPANVALASAGAQVSASGQEVAGKWGPELANDGDPTSRWSSNAADNAWIQVKLAKPTVVDHVTILWENACAAKYKLQVSNDGTTFTDATDVITPTCGAKDTEKLTKVDAATAYQYVRMQGIDRTPIGGQKYGMSLYELQVWNGPEPVIAPSTVNGLVPKPQNLTVATGAAPFVLSQGSRIVTDPALKPSADFLATQLRASTGFGLNVVTTGAQDGDIVFAKGDVTGYAGKDEAYGLVSSDKRVTVTSPTAHGAFNAVQTIRQLLPAFAASKTVVQTAWTIPAVTITDAPRFAYRGVMLDPARSFLTVDEVKAFLDTMAEYKLSTLHFHLSDDQGWRIQITNDGKEAGDPIDYSLLTTVSGATGMSKPGITYQDELGHTGYYTQAQYKDIVAYAAARQITVVPEIDAPSHTNAALHAIPQLNTPNTQPGVDESGTVPANGTGDVGYSTLDANAPITWTFMKHVLTQIAAMTPGEYIHVGGDESHVTPHNDYVKFITESVKIVHDLGKKAIGWNEAAVGGVTAGDGIQYWTGGTSDTLNAIKNQGAKLIASRGSSAYLDMKYNSKTPIGLTWAGTGDFPKYYNWDPASVVQDGGKNLPDSSLLGVEGPMWSETIRGGQQAEFLAFPRAISLAEMGWTDQSKRDVTDFTQRMAYQGDRLLAGGSNFYDGNAATWQWSMAGLPVAVSPNRDLTLSVGSLAAPGTKATSDGAGIATDTTDDADGMSSSTVGSSLSATIDWGDGSATTPATFRTDTARSALSAGGLYTLRGAHSYAGAGTFTGTVKASDGTSSTFTAKVAAGTPDPTTPAGWDPSVTPKLTVNPTVKAGGRLPGTLSGFEPGSYVTVKLGDTTLGTVRPGVDGTLPLSLPIPPETLTGDYAVTVTVGDRTATAPTHVNSTVVPLKDPIDQKTLSIAGVDSQETQGENAAATNAIDGDPATYWHTQWQAASPDYPHWIIIDLGKEYDVSGLSYLQRQGQSNGRMKDYDIYVGDAATPFTANADENAKAWGAPVASGTFLDLTRPQVVEFAAAKQGRYLMLVGKSSINGNAFGGAAEINVGGLPHVDQPTLSLSAGSVAAGGSVTVTAAKFTPNATLSISLEKAPALAVGRAGALAAEAVMLGQATVDASGAATAQFTIPATTAAGSYRVVATQTGDTPLEADAALTVTTAAGGGDNGGGDNGTGGNGTGGTGTGNGGTGTGTGTGTGGSTTGAGSKGTGLAETGSDVVAPITLAALALLAGLGLAVTRIRRRAHR